MDSARGEPEGGEKGRVWASGFSPPGYRVPLSRALIHSLGSPNYSEGWNVESSERKNHREEGGGRRRGRRESRGRIIIRRVLNVTSLKDLSGKDRHRLTGSKGGGKGRGRGKAESLWWEDLPNPILPTRFR